MFSPSAARDDAPLLAVSPRITHGLFSVHLAARGGRDRWLPCPAFRYETRRIGEHPFHSFRLADRFRREMWQIQDWTISRELRFALAQVTAYRADQAETAFLARLFGADEPRPQPAA